MIISPKDTVKLFGITVMTLCAVFVCTLFLNFNIDIQQIKDSITSPAVMAFYDAQVVMGKATSGISGGCLALTSVVMLLFYIKQYIDTHHKELGILKALGYSRIRIAKSFWIFGCSVFFGTLLGFLGSFLLMPTFYDVMNEDQILPAISVHFNMILVVFLVILPTIIFSILAIVYGYGKLKQPALTLLSGSQERKRRASKTRNKKAGAEIPFLKELKRNNRKSYPVLAFFIAFAAFCYSAMIQMTFSMNKISSAFFAVIILIIGIILAFVTLLLSVTSVVNGNAKYIALMKAYGYSFRECSTAVLQGYRPLAWAGFIIGTVYQYFLIKLMMETFSTTSVEIPQYEFHVSGFFITLVSFLVIYEVIMHVFALRIRDIPIKKIMFE